MSDEEYEYDYGSDADSIVYSEDGSEQGGEANEDGDMKIQVENFYYEAEDLKDDDAGAAVELFQKVVLLDTELEGKGESSLWRFKALVHIVTLLFGMKNYPDMISNYKEMLKDMPSVTRNVCTESINSVLETISSSDDDKVLEEMFEITLKALTDANNEKLWFNTNLKLTKLYMSGLEKTESMDTGSSLSTEKKQDEVERLMNILKQSCSLPDGNDDPSKASQLLEIYCLEIQFCRITHNVLRMRTIYPKTLHLNVAVADPRIMGVIREEGGKMHMSEGHWDEAYTELNEAFRNFQQAGNNSRAKTCLKYVALSSMLAKDAVNPFDGREAKAFERDSDIVAMKSLHQYLQQNDLQRFEGILNDKRNGISTEEVLMTYIQPLRRRMREHVLLNVVRPYKKVTLKFLARELRLTETEVETMVVSMILAEDLHARIDQIKGYVTIRDGEGARSTNVQAQTTSRNMQDKSGAVEGKRAKYIAAWAERLGHSNQSIVKKME